MMKQCQRCNGWGFWPNADTPKGVMGQAMWTCEDCDGLGVQGVTQEEFKDDPHRVKTYMELRQEFWASRDEEEYLAPAGHANPFGGVVA